MPTLRRPPLASLLPPRPDAALTLAVTVATVVCVYTAPLGSLNGEIRPGDALGVLIAIGMTAPLAWRRRWPLVGLAIVGACSFASYELDFATDPADLYFLFGIGSAALHTDRRTAVLLAAVSTAYQLYWWLGWMLPDIDASQVTSAIAAGIVPPVIGDSLRTQRAYSAAIAERAERQGRVHELEVAHAAEQERSRIARELHDIVGHHLSAIGVQARATRTLVDRSPERARAALTRLSELASAALDETRASVGAVRAGDAEAGNAPQPGLGQVDELLAVARSGGLRVGLRVDGERRPLPASIELCAYRVLQEALTNATRHGTAPAQAEVVLGFGPDRLELTVVSPFDAGRRARRRAGLGLVGMRERIALTGGTLEAGPTAADRWTVRARIPTESR